VFLQEPGEFQNVLLLVAVLAVTVVNSGLKVVIKSISFFECPVSFIELQKNVAEKGTYFPITTFRLPDCPYRTIRD
jgi:hypothetical protein